MRPPLHDYSELPHPQLRLALLPAAQRLRNTRRRNLRSKALLTSLLISLPITAIGFAIPAVADFSLLAVFATTAAFLIRSFKSENRITLDYLAAARAVESENKDLKQSLVTAVEQQYDRKPNFFADQVVRQALASPSQASWRNVAKATSRRPFFGYAASLAAVSLCLIASYLSSDWSPQLGADAADANRQATHLFVEPGDLEVERGSSLVITARFEGPLPQNVTLELLDDAGLVQSVEMAQSLSDPIFAYSLRGIDRPLRYHINYENSESEMYRISTYDLPALLQADARLKFPEYTGRGVRTIEDTLRVSAIEGTELSYRFNTNKPLRSAYLLDEQGQHIDLDISDDAGRQFLLNTTLSLSAAYRLHLEDEAGRRNAYPPEIRIEAVPNKRPSLRLKTPRGDQRLSALEEVVFSGSAEDDFGLQDYGIGFVYAVQDQEDISLAGTEFEPGSLRESIDYLLRLEDFELQPKDTLSWYLWATDFGPDGNLRRTTGDLYFADIRSFDEIFREQDQGGAGQSQAAGEGLELLEKQRSIAIALFRIKNSATNVETARDDMDVVQRSQVEALSELQQLIPQLQEASAIQYATEAQRFMEGVDLGVTTAIDTPSLSPLDLAWTDAQGAFDKLVKLTEDEFNVSRSQNQQGGSGGGKSRNQAQINELDFRHKDSRYETASQAQALTSPEDRQDLELIGKLNELSRRQDDMNERLQEMQGELANAQTEEERAQIQRELKRLEEEQRRMLADADEAIQQAGNRQSTQQAREQLEDARDNMQEASEQLGEGRVSQALASGTRAQDTLEKTRDQLREANSSQFSEAMREARSQASELAEAQNRLEEELAELQQASQRSLDDTSERENLAQRLETQSEELQSFLDQVREIAENSENVEVGLFRELYQVLRDSNGSRFEERYENSAQLLRQGFVDNASQKQQELSSDLDALSRAISEAAEGILGSQGATLQFAQSEIDSLSEQLEQEREPEQPRPDQGQGQSGQGSEAGQGSGPGQGSQAEQLRNALAGFGSSQNGPITGGDFGEWIGRLSTVESLIEEPMTRSRLAEARETAEEMRRDFKRRGELPKWELIVDEIAAPLNEVSSWLSSELNRIDNPDTLQSVDRDPVPEAYNRIVERYYESLATD